MADTALAEPAERVLASASTNPARRGRRGPLAELRRDAVRGFAKRGQRCRRACRGGGSIASIEERMNLDARRVWVKTSIFPESAQRRSVSGSTPRIRLASPASASHRAPGGLFEIRQI